MSGEKKLTRLSYMDEALSVWDKENDLSAYGRNGKQSG